MSALPPKTDIAELEEDVRFVPKADIAAAKASLFHPRPPAIAGGYMRRATGAALAEQLGAIVTTIGDVVRSSRNLIRYAGMVKSRSNEHPSFPRGAARAT